LNIVDNVALPLMFKRTPLYERRKKAIKFIEMMGLKGREEHRPTELSGGQQQRVAIARALVTNPEIILADEPTGNVDSKTGKKIMDYLKEINKKGKTICAVTHDSSLIHYATRVIYLKDGKIEKEDRVNK
jgi:putative ABC transport system ATP-binding protein